MPELGNALFGHAVSTAEVAAVGDGNAQIIDPPVMGIDETVHNGVYYSFSLSTGKEKFLYPIRNMEIAVQRIKINE